MDDIIDIPIVIENEELQPNYMTQEAAGADVRAHLKEPVTLLPGRSILIPTGMKMAIPPNYEIQVRPRSGLALKHGITVLNTPGTIDSDFRGEVGIILINHGLEPFIIMPGMRIAQLVAAKIARANFILSEELTTTCRGENGFGHTGKN